MKYKYIFDIKDIEKLDFSPQVAIIFYTKDSFALVKKVYDRLAIEYPNIKCIGSETFDISYIKYKIYQIRYYKYIVILYEDSFENISICRESEIDNILLHNYHKEKSYIALSAISPDKTESTISNLNLNHIYGMRSTDTIFYQGEFIKDSFLIANFIDNRIEGLSINEFDTIKLDIKITKATKNIIEEIEYTPAVEFMKTIIGEFDKQSIDEFRIPLILSDNRVENIYKLTSILSIDEEKNLIYTYREVKNGMKIDIGVLSDRKELLTRKRKFKSLIQKEEASYILFVCIGIEKFWKNLTDIRLLEISDILKRDLISIFGNGEIGKPNINMKSTLLNQTYTLTSIYKV